MREIIELRVVNEFAGLIFSDDEGEVLGTGLIKRIKLPSDNPRMAEIGKLQVALHRTRNKSFFHGWEYHRSYSPKEIAQAELFQFQIASFFEPDGVEYGTVYDESDVCSYCGAGRRLVGELILDLGRVPKGKDFAQTIARDEWIVSERLASLMREHGMTGAEFEPIKSAKKRREGSPIWYRLKITAPSVDVAPPTHFGIDPFDEDAEGLYRCPLGHTLGLNILSELSVRRDSWYSTDIAVTRQYVGHRQGVLVPSPLIVISPRLRQLFVEHHIKGFKTEVAYLV